MSHQESLPPSRQATIGPIKMGREEEKNGASSPIGIGDSDQVKITPESDTEILTQIGHFYT